MTKRITDVELLDNWFGGKYQDEWYGGDDTYPEESPELRTYMMRRWLPSVWNDQFKSSSPELPLARAMNEFWCRFKNLDDKPWLPGNRRSGVVYI